MAVIPAAGQVTALYRVRLAGTLARQSALLAGLWSVFNPEIPAESLAAIAAAAAPLVAAGQAMFTAEALAYLRALTAAAAGASVAATVPYAAPEGVTGFAFSGAPVGSLLGIAPRIYDQRRAQGWEQPDAVASARALVDGVAVSEPYRAANETVTRNAAADDRLTGRVNRVPEPDACEWCMRIADRGYIAHGTPGHPVTFAAHAHCRCTASPEIAAHVTGRRQVAYARRMTEGQRRAEAARRVPAQRQA